MRLRSSLIVSVIMAVGLSIGCASRTEQLVVDLGSEMPAVRAEAQTKLKARDPETVVDAINNVLADEAVDTEVKRRALVMLGEIAAKNPSVQPKAVPVAAEATQDKMLLTDAVAALVAMGPGVSGQIAEEMLKTPDTPAIRGLAVAIRVLKGRQAIPVLVDELRDTVRKAEAGRASEEDMTRMIRAAMALNYVTGEDMPSIMPAGADSPQLDVARKWIDWWEREEQIFEFP